MSVQEIIAEPRTARFVAANPCSRGTVVVLAATITMAMGFGGLGLTSVFMRPIEAEFGWTRSQTSLAYAFATVGMAVGGTVWGRLSDRIDVRVLLGVGGAGMVLSLLAMAGLQSLGLFYAASLAYGALGFSVLYSPLISTSGEWFPNCRGLVMGIVTAGGALGQGLLPFAGHIMIDVFGWRLAFAGIGAAMLASLALTLPALRWPSGTRAPITSTHGSPANAVSRQRLTIAFLGTAAFLCCVCMGVPLVHMASFVGMICGSQAIGVTSLLIAMLSGALGRVCFGVAADRIGPLASYAIASSIQTTCVLLFPLLENSVSFMVLSAVFGFGFAGNMTCVSLCVREAVPANRFGGALGVVMMIAWAGMASGGYLGGVLFDAASNYTFSFILAGAAGALNLLVIGALATTRIVAKAAISHP